MQYVQILKARGHGLLRDKFPPLAKLDIELTERCNNACIHCLINQPEKDADSLAAEMDTAFVKDILKQAADLGCLAVRFTGGEPLLRGDFAELYLFARRLGMRVTVFTNGRLITPDLARLFADFPPGREVEVSVYGMHAESYDAAAASPGAFDEFMLGVGLLQSHQIPFIVKFAVLPPNRHEIAEFEDFARPLTRSGRKPATLMNYDLRARRDHPAKNRFIRSLRLPADETLEWMRRNPDYTDSLRAFGARFLTPNGDRLFTCGAGHAPCVDSRGRLQMCLLLRHPETVLDLGGGNGAADEARPSLLRAVTEFIPRLRGMRAVNPEYLRRCARCFLKGLCEQCPAKSWMEHGTLDTPVEHLCRLAHAQARQLGLLAENENAWEAADWEARKERFVTRDGPTARPYA
jgi:MoaA/NifB/PqqE/SkfB family radical SAM enzyme